jgi:hypothetical protein
MGARTKQVCFDVLPGSYDTTLTYANSIFGRYPYYSEYQSLFTVGGYTNSNQVYPSDVWVPFLDSTNDWIQIGYHVHYVIGTKHCSIVGIGCPSWGTT